MNLETGKDVLDNVDSEHDPTYAESVRWCVLPGADRRRRVELRRLKPAWPPGVRTICNVSSDMVQSDDSVHPMPLDYGLATSRPRSKKERNGSLKISTTTPTLSSRLVMDFNIVISHCGPREPHDA
jgi:hypothetical protein